MAVRKTGRPAKEFDMRQFNDLVGYGCTQEEICWFFRDENGVHIHPDTLSRWCMRKYGMSFKEFKEKNGLMPLKIKLRQNQLELSKKSAAMAIFLGKNYLGQSDHAEIDDSEAVDILKAILRNNKENAKRVQSESEAE